MEDILASIRRILNDDGETASAPAGAPTEATPAEDVFELDGSMIIDEPTDHDHLAPAIEEPETPPPAVQTAAHVEPEHPTHEPEPEEPLVAPATAAAASASMGALVRVLGQRHTPVYRGGPTLEDMVRDELRPLVKNWLDENLAPMVERLVRAEIERVTSRNL
jgi:cell pole-organizing protein PopZ